MYVFFKERIGLFFINNCNIMTNLVNNFLCLNELFAEYRFQGTLNSNLDYFCPFSKSRPFENLSSYLFMVTNGQDKCRMISDV